MNDREYYPMTNRWVACPKPNSNASIRLFCFPYAGGGTSAFRAWFNDLPSTVEVYLVQLPGREGRFHDPPFTRMEPLIEALADHLFPYLVKPFVFFGHSMGALINYELAHFLHQWIDLCPCHLFVSAHRAPYLPNPYKPIHDSSEHTLIENMRMLNGTPLEVLQNKDLMQLVLPTLRADFAICETYHYISRDPLPCAISALGGLQDKHISRDDLLAWRHETRGSFTLRFFPGDHFFLHNAREQLLRALVEDLSVYLGI